MGEAHGIVITEPVQYTAEVCDCATCQSHAVYLQMATEAKEHYRADAEREWRDEVVATGDMMRVTMLPIRPLKECIFTPRVIAFNETFALAMPEDKIRRRQRRSSNKQHNCCVLWHEGVTGSSAEAVAASFLLYLKSACRDVRKVTLWVENAQHKKKIGYCYLPCFTP